MTLQVGTIRRDGATHWGRLSEDGTELIDLGGTSPSLRAHLSEQGNIEGLRDLDGPRIPLAEAEILPPVDSPGKIWCFGLNYDDYRQVLGLEFRDPPGVFLKAPTALVGHGASVGVPVGYGSVFHEWELTAVIGRRLSGATRDEAEAAIAGYTILSDLTMHELELSDRRFMQWAKNIDGFAPCGPWITSPEDLDLDAGVAMRRHKNGELISESTSSRMRYQLPELIEFISAFSTLEPGDLIASGTPPAGGCMPGDVIVGEIEGIGRLETTLVPRVVDLRWQHALTKP